MCKKPEQYEQIKFADPVSLGLGRNYAKPGQVLGLCGYGLRGIIERLHDYPH